MTSSKSVEILFRVKDIEKSLSFSVIEALAKIPNTPLSKELSDKLDEMFNEYTSYCIKHNSDKALEVLRERSILYDELAPVGIGYEFRISDKGEYIGWYSFYSVDGEPVDRVEALVKLIKEKCEGTELEIVIIN